jgi:hypothetical protein
VVKRWWWWSGPKGAAGAYPIGAVVLAGVFAAAVVRWDANGLGWTLGAFGASAAIVAAVRHARRRPTPAAPAPAVGDPATAEPTRAEPSTGEPASSEPAAGQPATGQPATEQLASGQLASGQPASGQPASGQPVTAQPAPDPLAAAAGAGVAGSGGSTPSGGPTPAEARSERLARYGWAAAALILVSMATIRAAGWLVALCMVFAFICASLAVGGGRYTRGLLLGLASVIATAFESLPWLFGGVGALRAGRTSQVKLARIVATIGVSIGLLLVFGSLFAAADPAFNKLVNDVLPTLNGQDVVRSIVMFFAVAGLCSGAIYLRLGSPRLEELRGRPPKPLGRFEWLVPVLVLDLLFLAFLIVQFEALVGGEKFINQMALPDYKEYVRQGFGQLVVVTGLTLIVIAFAARRAARQTRRDRVAARLVFGPLCLFTLGVVASALSRMIAYENEYGFTRLRLLGGVLEGWMGLIMLLVLGAGLTLQASWLPRTVLATFVATLIAVAAANPDGMVAQLNVNRFNDTGRINIEYVRTLSADAVPALATMPDEYLACVLQNKVRVLPDSPDPWPSYNYGRSRARDILLAHRDLDQRTCQQYHDPYLGNRD